MSVLSIEDIKCEIGNNLFIYPLKEDNIKGNSVNLTVSKFAWSIQSKKSIYNQETNEVIINPNDSALIYTNEAIYVTNKIGGTYHSKVSLVAQGAGHIGTTLDPQYMGLSLITVHNHHPKDHIKLKVGSSFVSIVFHYLKTPPYSIAHNNTPGQIGILNGYDIKEFSKWAEERDWANETRKLINKVKNSPELKDLKESLRGERKQRHKLLLRLLDNPIAKYLCFVVLFVGGYYITNYLQNLLPATYDMIQIAYFTASITLFLTTIVSDVKKLLE
ncbi:hypothetical protein ABDB91_18900 [Desulfoscipio sp. XC116]|uniref:dCTP deaminase domain-containing protein n=1 Tax=Desulfoscipio sp. XC116 TaxID=3144975 RepID=UPI00325B884A